MKSKIYIGTNTKMYKTIADTVSYLKELKELTADIDRNLMELFVIPSYTALKVQEKLFQMTSLRSVHKTCAGRIRVSSQVKSHH